MKYCPLIFLDLSNRYTSREPPLLNLDQKMIEKDISKDPQRNMAARWLTYALNQQFRSFSVSALVKAWSYQRVVQTGADTHILVLYGRQVCTVIMTMVSGQPQRISASQIRRQEKEVFTHPSVGRHHRTGAAWAGAYEAGLGRVPSHGSCFDNVSEIKGFGGVGTPVWCPANPREPVCCMKENGANSEVCDDPENLSAPHGHWKWRGHSKGTCCIWSW